MFKTCYTVLTDVLTCYHKNKRISHSFEYFAERNLYILHRPWRQSDNQTQHRNKFGTENKYQIIGHSQSQWALRSVDGKVTRTTLKNSWPIGWQILSHMKNGRRNIRGCLVVFLGARHYDLFISGGKFIK